MSQHESLGHFHGFENSRFHKVCCFNSSLKLHVFRNGYGLARRTGVTTPQPANSHQALRIPEVLGLIFRDLTDEKTALANLARCCRLFSEAALNVLWRELLNLRPLLDLLPTNLWDEFGNVLVRRDLCPDV